VNLFDRGPSPLIPLPIGWGEGDLFARELLENGIGVGTGEIAPAPPSEPDGRFSRIRLSG
jgi:hypothetical protein